MLKMRSTFRLIATPLFILSVSIPVNAYADAGVLRFKTELSSVYENQSEIIKVARTGGSDGEVSVEFTTADGTATAGDDYETSAGVLTWGDGEAGTKTFEVIAYDDDDHGEDTETVTLALSNPTGGATLGDLSEATLRIANTCSNPEDMIADCPSGVDSFNSKAVLEPVDGVSIKLRGPTHVFRGEPVDAIVNHPVLEDVGEIDGVNDVIETEMYSLNLTGEIEDDLVINGFTIPGGTQLTLRAGDGEGNLEDDTPPGEESLYSPGAVYHEIPGDTTSRICSFFLVFFELLIDSEPASEEIIALLGLENPLRVETCEIIILPPILVHYTHAIAKLLHTPTPDPFPPLAIILKSFTAEAQGNGQVAINWETSMEKNNAAFQIWRANPLDGKCSDDPNNYVNVQSVAPLIYSKGTDVSGAKYHYPDTGLTAGETYCYALADIEYDSEEPTFHLDKVREVVAR